MGTVKLFQLLSGDLLIGEEFGEPTGLKTHIKNPLRVIMMPQQGQSKSASIAFAPFCEFSEDKIIEFDNVHILCMMTPIQQFLNQYQSTFGSIMTPQPKLIIPGA